MSVFEQVSRTLTELGKQLGESDHSLKAKYSGSAPLDHSITAESWLPGTTGAHCNVTHGDRWEEIKGAVTQHFYDKKTSTHDGEFTETYNDDATRHMYGATTENHFGHKSENYYSPNSLETWANNHVEWNNFFGLYGQDWYKSFYINLSVSVTNVQIVAGSLAIALLGAIQLNLLQLDYSVLWHEVKGRKLVFTGSGIKIAASEDDIAPLKQEIGALRLDMRIAENDIETIAVKTGVHLAAVHIPA